jgi:hypothetical protein
LGFVQYEPFFTRAALAWAAPGFPAVSQQEELEGEQEVAQVAFDHD